MLIGGHRARLDGNWGRSPGRGANGAATTPAGETRSRLAHPADGPGRPDEADPDVGLKGGARDPTRANRRPNRALQGEVLDVQCLNPALRVTPLPLLRPQLLPAQLGGRCVLFSHASLPESATAAFDRRHHRSIWWQRDAKLPQRPVERLEENVLGQTQRDRGLIGRVLVELLLEIAASDRYPSGSH